MYSLLLPAKASVVIIGAGPTGLTAANLLGQAGIETLVIESNTDTCTFPRAVAIDDEGLRVLQTCGLLEDVIAHMRLNVKAHYIAAHHFLAKIAPQERRNGFPPICAFHQPTLERILLKGLERFPCVKVYFEHTLASFTQEEHCVHLSINTPDNHLFPLECAYLLGCDGGKSLVRRLLSIPMQRTGRVRDAQQQKWLVVDAIDESEPSDTIFFLCNPSRPAVSVPGPGTQRRWEFMLLPGEQEEDLLRAESVTQLIMQTMHAIQNASGDLGRGGTLRHLLQRTGSLPSCAQDAAPTAFSEMDAYPDISHKAHISTGSMQITRQTIYTFHALIAARFAQGHTFLLGDAAHLMPPFGGQGMNSGLRDAHNLCWKLQLVLQNRAAPTLLASYQQERYPHVAEMIRFSSFLGTIIMTTRPSIALLRDLFLRIINKLPPMREMLTEMRIKPQPRYKDGLLLKSSVRGMQKLVGAFFPQPYVLTQEGRRVLLDEILGNDFALIRLYEGTDAFRGVKHELWETLRVRFIAVKSPLSAEQSMVALLENAQSDRSCYIIDSERRISNFLHHRRDIYVLVRPDRYVLGVFLVRDILEFAKDLQSVLSRNTKS
jgi:3-(3-hydroxy-phenyl)propionate hydroxylase